MNCTIKVKNSPGRCQEMINNGKSERKIKREDRSRSINGYLKGLSEGEQRINGGDKVTEEIMNKN